MRGENSVKQPNSLFSLHFSISFHIMVLGIRTRKGFPGEELKKEPSALAKAPFYGKALRACTRNDRRILLYGIR